MDLHDLSNSYVSPRKGGCLEYKQRITKSVAQNPSIAQGSCLRDGSIYRFFVHQPYLNLTFMT